MVKNPSARARDVRDLGQKDPLEKGMAMHSSILAWRIPWTEEPVGLQFMGSHRVGYNGMGGRRRRGRQRMRWLDGITDSMDMGLGEL